MYNRNRDGVRVVLFVILIGLWFVLYGVYLFCSLVLLFLCFLFCSV